ncbi:type II secretion system F family protein [Planotetraspora kaengkrachanensis]|uniref:Type II secretion system protein n=1 Tax=Planotetraspora kaengkrachanensis TaxID=575193 RepID=A0A8J3Q1J3_9ACTN|nr:type II secretion system F family protein [Planotetraspora kaengkrachanensis]GIG84903.1 type II secretion system protein [Planotetraspora kaengkrachanensis]
MRLVPPGVLDPLVLLCGAVLGGGLFLFVLALYGVRPRPATPDRGAERAETFKKLSTRIAVAIVIGVVILVLTGWPVIAVGVVVLVLAWPGLAGGMAEERRAMQNLEALAAWTESLRDTIAGAAGLEQAIPASIRAAAPSLQPHLRELVDRLHTRMPLQDALRLLADDLADPSADLVIAALILNAKLRGPGLRDVLSALAASAREELDMRRKVEADRASTRKSVHIVVIASMGFAGGLVVFNREYVEDYATLLGQAVLVVVAGLFGAGFAWMRKLAKFDKPARILAPYRQAPVLQDPAAALSPSGVIMHKFPSRGGDLLDDQS